MSGGMTRLNPKLNSEKGEELRQYITSHLIGHKRAVDMFVDAYEVALSNEYFIQEKFGLSEDEVKDFERPVITATLLGPSGVGKTFLAKLIGRFLMDTYIREFAMPNEPLKIPRDIVSKIECASYNTPYEMGRVLGASPGYLGYDKVPYLDQRNVDAPAFKILRQLASRISTEAGIREEQIRMLENEKIGISETAQINAQNDLIDQEVQELKSYLREHLGIRIWSVILLDEIEKGHYSLHDFLLEAVEEGRATMANGRVTYFRDSIIILTSNAGSEAISDKMRGKISLGFSGKEGSGASVYELAMKEFKKMFRPEFIGRLEENIQVLRPLTVEEMRKTIRMQLNRKIQSLRLRNDRLIGISYTKEFFEFLVEKSTDHPEYGVRPARSKINKYVVKAITKIISSKQAAAGDQIILHIEEVDGKRRVLYIKRHAPKETLIIKSGNMEME